MPAGCERNPRDPEASIPELLDASALSEIAFVEPAQMPWTPDDAERHAQKATTWALKELWAKVANGCLERSGDEGRAIREANAVVARQAQKPATRRGSWSEGYSRCVIVSAQGSNVIACAKL